MSVNATGREDSQDPFYRLRQCRPPYRLLVSFGEHDESQLRLELVEHRGYTTLHFAQRLTDPELGASVGPAGITTSTGSSRQLAAETWQASAGTTTSQR